MKSLLQSDLVKAAVRVAGEPLSVEMFDGRAVAKLCSCSVRHVRRLAEAGRMPPPRRLGNLVRWWRREIEDWIAAGCPEVRQTGKR